MNEILHMPTYEYKKWLKAHTTPAELVLSSKEKRWMKEKNKKDYYYSCCCQLERENNKIKYLKKDYKISDAMAEKLFKHYKALVKILEKEGGFIYAPEIKNPLVSDKKKQSNPKRKAGTK